MAGQRVERTCRNPLAIREAAKCGSPVIDNVGMTTVMIRYFDGCPNWHEAEALLNEALAIVGLEDVKVERHQVETVNDAVRAGFIGSPTILIDGMDPFAVDGAQPGLACRVYSTPVGLRGSPTLEQLLTVLRG